MSSKIIISIFEKWILFQLQILAACSCSRMATILVRLSWSFVPVKETTFLWVWADFKKFERFLVKHLRITLNAKWLTQTIISSSFLLMRLFGSRESSGNSVSPQTHKALPTYPSLHTVCKAKLFARSGVVDCSPAPTSQRFDKLHYLTA